MKPIDAEKARALAEFVMALFEELEKPGVSDESSIRWMLERAEDACALASDILDATGTEGT